MVVTTSMFGARLERFKRRKSRQGYQMFPWVSQAVEAISSSLCVVGSSSLSMVVANLSEDMQTQHVLSHK